MPLHHRDTGEEYRPNTTEWLSGAALRLDAVPDHLTPEVKRKKRSEAPKPPLFSGLM